MQKSINFLSSFFVKKLAIKDIENILVKENFIFTDDDVKDLLSGNKKGVRYGAKILERVEGQQKVERFIKIVLDGKWQTYQLFKRQVFVTEVVQNNPEKESEVIKVINS